MLSIVCVYNKKDVFEDTLLKSLKNQTVPFELVALDNSHGEYSSVALALNAGGSMCSQGKYIMFVHQDVSLLSSSWLADAERCLDSISLLGIAGVAGARRQGGWDFDSHLVGYIQSGKDEWGCPIAKPVPVQTVDELLLIIPRSVFDRIKFDDRRFDFIHLFGADYSLRVARDGFGVYVIPGPVLHKSTGNFYSIDRYRIKLLLSHLDASPIFTTCGAISLAKLPKFIVLALLPQKLPVIMRNIRNKMIGKNIDARGTSKKK